MRDEGGRYCLWIELICSMALEIAYAVAVVIALKLPMIDFIIIGLQLLLSTIVSGSIIINTCVNLLSRNFVIGYNN